MPIAAPDNAGWIVCLATARAVEGGRVRCPIARRRVPLDTCVVCHRLAAVAEEHDPRHGCEIGVDDGSIRSG